MTSKPQYDLDLKKNFSKFPLFINSYVKIIREFPATSTTESQEILLEFYTNGISIHRTNIIDIIHF